ncbi:MAG: ABC transporter ATP-binding protein [Campylobacterales bacterium]|nr:ABC transporter ATP-binding protein [Campylobacterales bacterium]
MVEANEIGFYYKSENWLFKDIDFRLLAGEILAILGPNGRGKTTLLKCMAGLLKPCKGSIRAPSKIGFVPQLSAPPQGFSVFDIVLMGASASKGVFEIPGAKEYKIAEESCELVGIENLLDKEFSELSGGQRQMVLIARALCHGRETLILDEPASALDLANQKKLSSLLQKLAACGTTIIMTTHAPNHAFDIADKSLMLFGGDEYLFGDTKEVLDSNNLSRLFATKIVCVNYEADGKNEIAAVAV